MASTFLYDPSFEKLKTLQRAAQGTVDLTLPERPSSPGAGLHRYLSGTISMLSESEVSLYGNSRYFDGRLDEIITRLEKIDRTGTSFFDYLNRRFDKDVRLQFEKVDDRLVKLGEDVKITQGDVSTIKEDIKTNKEDVKTTKEDIKIIKGDINDLNQRFDDMRAMSLNRFARTLHARIKKVAAPVRDENGQIKYEVAAGFPKTVRGFWLLQQEITTLINLAKHHSVEGWEDWNSQSWDDSDASQYDLLEDAVKEHPQKCLRALAAEWGLEYGQLEKPTRDKGQSFTKAPKRKAEGETEPRRVRTKVTSDCETEIAIVSTAGQEVKSRRKIIRFEPDMELHSQMTVEEVLRQYDVPDSGTRVESQELGYETSSSVRAARHIVQAKLGMNPSTPDEKRRVSRTSPMTTITSKNEEELGQ